MKSSALLFVLILLLPFSSFAQSDSVSARPHYFFSVYSGALLAKKGNGTSVTTAIIQGIRYKRFAIGAGVGYDAYLDWRVVPLFLSTAFDLISGVNNSLFIQINGGYCEAWNRTANEVQFTFEEQRAMVFHPSLGYRIQSQNMSVYLSAGYKFQSIRYDQTPTWVGWGTKTTIDRNIERLSVLIGFGFR
jgi:hypothetical protein